MEILPTSRPLLRAVVLYLLIAGPVCFFWLGSTDVVTMEGIVADGARTMARTGDLAVPRLHGEIYSYKPPLAYWLALASFELFGTETEWTLRLPFALSGFAMGLAVLLLAGGPAPPRTALLCAVASVTGAVTLQKLHLAEFDVPLAAGVGVAAAVACRNLADRPRGALWPIGYLALAAGFLAKGAPALMFYAPGLLLAAVATRGIKRLFRPAHLAGVALFAGVVAGWLLAAYQAEGWGAFEQPIAEAREKGMTWSVETVVSTLAKPFVVWALFLPWTLLLPRSFGGAWSSGPARRMAIAAGSFAAAGVAVFMLVPATESRYLLPLAAPVGILCGLAAEPVLAAGGFRRRAIEVFALLVAAGAVAVALTADSTDLASRMLVTVAAAATLALVGRLAFRPDASRTGTLVVAVALLGWLAHVRGVEPHRAGSRSLKAMAAAFEAHLEPGEAVWTGPVDKGFHHSSLFFYLRRPVRTFSPEGGAADGPEPGDHVVFFSDEHRELMAHTPFGYEVLERRPHRRDELFLARVTDGER